MMMVGRVDGEEVSEGVGEGVEDVVGGVADGADGILEAVFEQ